MPEHGAAAASKPGKASTGCPPASDALAVLADSTLAPNPRGQKVPTPNTHTHNFHLHAPTPAWQAHVSTLRPLWQLPPGRTASPPHYNSPQTRLLSKAAWTRFQCLTTPCPRRSPDVSATIPTSHTVLGPPVSPQTHSHLEPYDPFWREGLQMYRLGRGHVEEGARKERGATDTGKMPCGDGGREQRTQAPPGTGEARDRSAL